MTMRREPKIIPCVTVPGRRSEASVNSDAPTIGPKTDLRPPSTTMNRMLADRVGSNESGAIKPI
jgi:hypothetical protein